MRELITNILSVLLLTRTFLTDSLIHIGEKEKIVDVVEIASEGGHVEITEIYD